MEKKIAEVELIEVRPNGLVMVWLTTGKWIEDYYLQKVRSLAKNIKNGKSQPSLKEPTNRLD